MKKLKHKKRKKVEATIQNIPIVRYQTDIEHGLSEEQANERIEHHLVNDTKIKTSNSYFHIFAKNIFTIFNFIWFMIAVALMCVGSWSDLVFLFVVIANTAISIFQEVKSKNTVEKLSMVSVPRIKVVRMGIQLEVNCEDLLLDDIIMLENGNQIPADCIVVDGMVEANESLLTGESNAIKKNVGDTLLAGSFLVSGFCYARVDKVGKSNYIQTIAEKTKDFKPQTSNLFKDLNSLIKVIILLLIPIGVMTFFKEYFATDSTIKSTITNTSGALEGMIPAGMYLLITIGLTVGVIKLAKKKTLVKNIYSIEMLARANILCLDKTGTITDGTMNVVQVEPQNGAKLEKIEKIVKSVMANQKYLNATSVALIDKFGQDLVPDATEVIEFSSQRKYSATTLRNGKTYYIGAVGFIGCQVTNSQRELMNSYMEQGYRVIALVEDKNKYNEKNAGKNGTLICFFVLEDHIRKDAVETIQWFKDNKVEIKIISGDDALTVSKIAKRVGVEGSERYISLEGMSLQEVSQIANKFTVFGRVTPEQKHAIVKALKTQGNIVAMTGDGVNDTLALKEANCSIAMADGSEVARNISHLVLMESNFSALPAVVKEGRQVINNVQESSVLYLMKTLFTMILCVTTLILRVSYPFTPKQMLILEMFVIGLPSVLMTFQPNSAPIKGNFFGQVFKRTIPRSLLLFTNILTVILLYEGGITLNSEEYVTLCTMLLPAIGLVNLFSLCVPFSWFKAICCGISTACVVTAIFTMGKFFGITALSFPVVVTFATLLLCSALLAGGVVYAINWLKKKKFFQAQSETWNAFWDKFTSAFSKFKREKDSSITLMDEELPIAVKNDKSQVEVTGEEKEPATETSQPVKEKKSRKKKSKQTENK